MDAHSLEILINGVGIGGYVILCLCSALSDQPLATRSIGTAFFLTATAAAIEASSVFGAVDHKILTAISLLSNAAPGMFWAYALVLFADRKPLTPWHWLPPAICVLLTTAGLLAPASSKNLIQAVMSLFSILLVTGASALIWRGWRGDLVETRRKLRAPVMSVAGVYVGVVSIDSIAALINGRFLIGPFVDSMFLTALAIGGVIALLRIDPALVQNGLGVQRAKRSQISGVAEQAVLARLRRAMDQEEVWRREDLSVRALADHISVREHQLRKLINGELGHRNFGAFINTRRIEAAKIALSNPVHYRMSISVIAFGLGFGSLGPFNRAFKEITGSTPTAWRQAAMTDSSPPFE